MFINAQCSVFFSEGAFYSISESQDDVKRFDFHCSFNDEESLSYFQSVYFVSLIN